MLLNYTYTDYYAYSFKGKSEFFAAAIHADGLSWPHVTVATLRKVYEKPVDLGKLAPRMPVDVRHDIEEKQRQLARQMKLN